MAKLNVTIPAVDVMVNGQAYRKVDRKAQAGDIVKALSVGLDITEGAFYAVYADGDGDPAFRDNGGDARCVFLENRDRYETYAPVSAPVPVESATIMHGGDTYHKVDRSAREGDVVVFPEAPYRYLTSGQAYLVDYIDSEGDAQITDDDGDSFDTNDETFDVYEKVAQPSIEYREEQRPLVREVKRWAEKGERIRIVNLHRYEHHYKQGAEFIVNDTDGDGDVRVTCGGSNRKLVCLSEYVVLEAIAPTYVEVKRKANVGERIKIVKRMFPSDPYQNGDELTVSERLDSERITVQVRGRNAIVRSEEYVVLEPLTPMQPPKYSAGDYVKVTGNSVSHNYTVGSVVKIVRTKDNPCYGGQQFEAEEADGTTGNWLVTNDVEPADEAAFEAQRKPKSVFSVGDTVKLTIADSETPHYGWGSVSNGDVGKVSSVSSDRIRVNFPKHGGWSGKPGELMKISADEVAVIEKEAEETAKWAAIGRKVGEFKRGDIVSFVKTGGEKGVGTVEDSGSINDCIGVRIGAQPYDGEKYRGVFFDEGDVANLIVPVEQRFDKPQEGAVSPASAA